jgi:hypothetical protein
MGRPVNKRYFGTTVVDGTARTGEENFSVTVKVGTNAVSAEGIIVRQRSSRKFLVNDLADGTGNIGVCILVDKVTPDNNEMILEGVITGSGDRVNVARIYNRTCRDYDGNRYTWEIQDDSSTNIMVLTAI